MSVSRKMQVFAGAAFLFTITASPALACFGASISTRALGELLLTALFAALGLSLVLIPAFAVFWVAKGLLYRRILKKPVFRNLFKAHLRAFAAILVVGVCYFVLDNHMPSSALDMTPEGKLVRTTEDTRWIMSVVSTGMLLLFFTALYVLERKLFRKEENTPRRFRVALVLMNVLAAIVLWFVVAAYSLASCGTIILGDIPKIDIRDVKGEFK